MTSVGLSPYVYALFAAGVLASVVTVIVLGRFRLYSRRVRIPFALLSLSGAIWATAYGFSLLASTAGAARFYLDIAWVSSTLVPTAWFIFSIVYAGERQTLSRRVVALVTVEPAVTIALTMTNQFHGLFVSPTILRTGFAESLSVGGSPLFVLHIVYTAGIVFAGLSILAKTALSSSGVHRRQATLLSMMGGIPIASFGTTLFWRQVSPLDPTPASFAVSSAIVLWALLRYRLFDITPIARNAILSEMRDAVVVLDDHDRIIESNGAAADLLVCPEGECIGRPVLDVVRQPSAVKAVLDGRDRVETTIEDERSRRYFEIRCSPVGEQTGNRARLLVFHDVTDRRQTEEEFRALIENSRDVITVLDESGVRKYTSPSMADVLGYDPESLVGEHVLDLVHPDDRDTVERRLVDAICGDEPVRSEFRVRHKNGTWCRFETVGVNLLDDPAVDGIVLNSRDVTNRHRYEQRLRVLNRVLRHDLRNDMNVILGHADLLLDERIPVESKDHARTIKRKARSLVELSEQTRNIDTTLNRKSEGLTPVEIVARIESHLDTIESEYPQAIVHRTLPDEQWVYADELVESGLKNLIDNALEHNDRILPEVGVSIEATPVSDDFVEIRITDNGPGIPQAELSVLESGTETPLQHISGLGLWLVHWIIDRSNGHLRFTENEPRGTVAIVRLQQLDKSARSSVRATTETQTD
ncbi:MULTISPECIES: histidine kinase N-terminal 7TM domain-containing protein [Haloferax]|uniref:histidine kinase n=2 Tax=Haloferax TaxID=2251 RepID=A0A6G1Z4F3_9EURY|nr:MULTISPECIES: histidine kinase N-terminal 7TM domain-containing protein [Haloferax]KAB1188727.1 PAS domain S-box protein [Haloferax sp. CBA1149]MRW81439.1 PAS domain S-box protein [Haloferax marinisediminis]